MGDKKTTIRFSPVHSSRENPQEHVDANRKTSDGEKTYLGKTYQSPGYGPMPRSIPVRRK